MDLAWTDQPQLAGVLYAQAPVDHANDHERAAVPDVDVADDASMLVLAVVGVVEEPQQGLYSHQGDDKDAEPRMRRVEELRVSAPICVRRAHLDPGRHSRGQNDGRPLFRRRTLPTCRNRRAAASSRGRTSDGSSAT